MPSSDPDQQQNKSDYSRVLDKAYSYLARREYSQAELLWKLKNLADESVCQKVLSFLIKANMQSDARYAEMLCHSRFNNGKGPIKVKYELQQKGIDTELIEQAIEPYNDQWQELAEQVRERKFGSTQPTSFKEWSKQARFLQQRGFSNEHIKQFRDL